MLKTVMRGLSHLLANSCARLLLLHWNTFENIQILQSFLLASALTSRRAGCDAAFGVSLGETASSADLGVSSKYSNSYYYHISLHTNIFYRDISLFHKILL